MKSDEEKFQDLIDSAQRENNAKLIAIVVTAVIGLACIIKQIFFK